MKWIFVAFLIFNSQTLFGQSYFNRYSNEVSATSHVSNIFAYQDVFETVGSRRAALDVFLGKPQILRFEVDTGDLIQDTTYFLGDTLGYTIDHAIRHEDKTYCAGIVRSERGTENYDNLLLIFEGTDVDTVIRYGDSTVWDRLYGVVLDDEGNIIVGGVTRKGTGNSSGVITKMTPQGDIIWKQGIDGDSSTHPWWSFSVVSVSVDEDGDIYALARYDDKVTVTKLDGETGESIWFKYIISDFSVPEEIQRSADGNFLLSCYASLPEFPGFRTHVFIKMNTDGEVLWLQEYLQEVGQSAYQSKFKQLSGGRFAKVYSAFGHPSLLIADEDGEVEQVFHYDQVEALFPDDVVQVSDGSFITTGYMSPNQNPERNTLWILKTDPDGGLSVGTEEVFGGLVVKVYPNPTMDYLTITTPSQLVENIGYMIVDARGRIMMKTEEKLIDVSSLPSGHYYVLASDTHGIFYSGAFVKL